MTRRYRNSMLAGATMIIALSFGALLAHAQAPSPAPAVPLATARAVPAVPAPVVPAVPASVVPAAPAPVVPAAPAFAVPAAPAQAPAPPVQPPAAAQPPRPVETVTPLQVQFVLSRFQGEKKLSSVPYTLTLTSGGPRNQARLRMGAQVAVPATSYTPQGASADGKPNAPLTSYNYRDIGTSIDARAVNASDGRFELTITVEDSSVFPEASADAGPRVANVPVFRTFSASSTLLLRDGQTGQFTTATDKITGEVLRIEVTPRVVK